MPEKEAARQSGDRKSTHLNSSHTIISYAVFCLKKEDGDPHGNFSRILRASRFQKPGVLILLGHCELHAPFQMTVALFFFKDWGHHGILPFSHPDPPTV